MTTERIVAEMLSVLTSEERIRERQFEILQNIARLLSMPDTMERGRELLLRSLEAADSFTSSKEALNSLTRMVGLYPYMDPERLSISDALAYELHRPPGLEDEGIVFHREQAEIYRRLMQGDNVVLSAPTSFGKSRIIDAVVATEKFQNIVIIVPTIALMDETRRRLGSLHRSYKVITHVTQAQEDRNIFVLTAERANLIEDLPPIDFFVIELSRSIKSSTGS